MLAPLFSADDFTNALQALFPRGRVWPREPDATQKAVAAGLAPSCRNLNARANDLLVDA